MYSIKRLKNLEDVFLYYIYMSYWQSPNPPCDTNRLRLLASNSHYKPPCIYLLAKPLNQRPINAFLTGSDTSQHLACNPVALEGLFRKLRPLDTIVCRTLAVGFCVSCISDRVFV